MPLGYAPSGVNVYTGSRLVLYDDTVRPSYVKLTLYRTSWKVVGQLASV